MAQIVLPKLDPRPLRAVADRKRRTPADWAAAAGMTRNTLYKRLYEPLGWYTADRLAIALGLHPCEVWGDEWWQIAKVYDAAIDQSKAARNDRKRQARRRERDRVAMGETSEGTPARQLATHGLPVG